MSKVGEVGMSFGTSSQAYPQGFDIQLLHLIGLLIGRDYGILFIVLEDVGTAVLSSHFIAISYTFILHCCTDSELERFFPVDIFLGKIPENVWYGSIWIECDRMRLNPSLSNFCGGLFLSFDWQRVWFPHGIANQDSKRHGLQRSALCLRTLQNPGQKRCVVYWLCVKTNHARQLSDCICFLYRCILCSSSAPRKFSCQHV